MDVRVGPYKSWTLKNWCFWTVVVKTTLESPLDYKEIQPVHPKENQPWIFIGRTDAEAGAPLLWPPDAKNWLIGKYLDAGKDWRQEEKGLTEDEMVGWHHQLYGHEFQQAPGIGDRQGSLACCDSWGRKESDMTEETELNWISNHSIIFKTVNKKLFNFIHCFNHKVDFLVDSTMPMKHKQLHFDANSNSGSKE